MKLDLTRYEGHMRGPWDVEVNGEYTETTACGPIKATMQRDLEAMKREGAATARLTLDAPKLLAEVVESRRKIEQLRELVKKAYEEGGNDGDEESGVYSVAWLESDARAELEGE